MNSFELSVYASKKQGLHGIQQAEHFSLRTKKGHRLA
jgi:hypothetical protein